MASNPRRKSDAARRANQVIRSRTVLVMLLLGIVTFAVLFWKLYDIQIRQHSVLQEKAIEQQTRSAVVNASRGTVYDRNLNKLRDPHRRDVYSGGCKHLSDADRGVCGEPKGKAGEGRQEGGG